MSSIQVFSQIVASEDSRVENKCSLNEFYVPVTIDEPRQVSKKEKEQEEKGKEEEEKKREEEEEERESRCPVLKFAVVIISS